MSYQVQGFLDFFFVRRRITSVGGRIEDALGTVENFVDELYLSEAFDMFRI